MDKKGNDRRSVLMIISSMLIFGTIGVFRRSVPLPSAFLAFSRGILGCLFILAFKQLKRKKHRQDCSFGLPPGLRFQVRLWG
ncbi:MAG: hypothetical protein K5663_05855 [Clostridiales bacterium]|nr:hypothetical protein [Clostridiales bacterium]